MSNHVAVETIEYRQEDVSTVKVFMNYNTCV